jgi:hypothetical protein
VASGLELTHWLTDAALHCYVFSPDGYQTMAGDSFGSVHFLELMGIEAAKVIPADTVALIEQGPESRIGVLCPSFRSLG